MMDSAKETPPNGLGHHHLTALNFAMKPMMIPPTGTTPRNATTNGLSNSLHHNHHLNHPRSPPGSLSPNLPSIVKVEPRLPSPCLNSALNEGASNGNIHHPSTTTAGNGIGGPKRMRIDDWGIVPPSPGQLSIGSLSPPPLMNGHSLPNVGHNGLSPTSSSYDSFSPNVLLWLSHTRADKAVEEFLDGPSASSAGSSGSGGTGSGYKKARATFPDDFLNEDSVRLGPCSVPKIKKEPAESSRPSASGLQPIARKRAALQAAAASGSSTAGTGLSESSPEVSSSQNGTGISPVPSLASSEIGEVDLDFWDLDIHESSTSHSSGKEDMSPPNSVNGCYSVDSFGDPKKKKGPAPRQQEELCLVCGDRASGYHYNALTCEGCKGFFRRSITKNAVYQCKYGNNCEIDMYMRRKCQECRLKKCLSVGMRPECVVPEYQCAIKRESKRAQKDKDKPNSTTKDAMSPEKIEEKPSILTSNTVNINSNVIKPLTAAQEEMIKKLVYFQEEFESPSEEEVKKITPFPLGDSEADSLKRFQHVTEMTILTVQLIVEFSKRVPGFDTLLREDQITLLKACSSEVMMLRCSRKYDLKTDSIVYANNQPYTRENYRSANVDYSADALFNFCRSMCTLKVDNAEYALLTAIVIFSERPALMEPKKVEKIQEFYIDTLKAYVDNHRPPGRCYFARLLAILTELRTLGNINSEMCFSLKVQNKKLPPFLAEIWDIQE